MPIHEKLRAPDFPAIRNYLRVSLINIHDELIGALDVPAVVQCARWRTHVRPLIAHVAVSAVDGTVNITAQFTSSR